MTAQREADAGREELNPFKIATRQFDLAADVFGLDAQAVLRHKAASGVVEGAPDSEPLGCEDVLGVDCDIQLPASLENVITLANVGRVRGIFP